MPGSPDIILDVGAGNGVWGKIAKQVFCPCAVAGSEIRDIPQCPDYCAWGIGDFTEQSWSGFDLVMGNPPYYCAELCVRKGLDALVDGGHLVFLLRLAFLEGKGRAAGLFTEHPPKLVCVCPGRPSFYEGKSGMTAFAFFLWQKGWSGETQLNWGNDYERKRLEHIARR